MNVSSASPDLASVTYGCTDWWRAGAAWGAMLDYSHYTGDPSYDSVVTEALLSQVGPKFDYMTEQYSGSTGNDDQAFWGFTVLEAAERNLPQPKDNIPPWLDLATNIWNSMVVRWNTTTCDGGFNWQIFPDNPNGMDYKNSVPTAASSRSQPASHAQPATPRTLSGRRRYGTGRRRSAYSTRALGSSTTALMPQTIALPSTMASSRTHRPFTRTAPQCSTTTPTETRLGPTVRPSFSTAVRYTSAYPITQRQRISCMSRPVSPTGHVAPT